MPQLQVMWSLPALRHASLRVQRAIRAAAH